MYYYKANNKKNKAEHTIYFSFYFVNAVYRAINVSDKNSDIGYNVITNCLSYLNRA
jgi:hypothetical protein